MPNASAYAAPLRALPRGATALLGVGLNAAVVV